MTSEISSTLRQPHTPYRSEYEKKGFEIDQKISELEKTIASYNANTLSIDDFKNCCSVCKTITQKTEQLYNESKISYWKFSRLKTKQKDIWNWVNRTNAFFNVRID